MVTPRRGMCIDPNDYVYAEARWNQTYTLLNSKNPFTIPSRFLEIKLASSALLRVKRFALTSPSSDRCSECLITVLQSERRQRRIDVVKDLAVRTAGCICTEPCSPACSLCIAEPPGRTRMPMFLSHSSGVLRRGPFLCILFFMASFWFVPYSFRL